MITKRICVSHTEPINAVELHGFDDSGGRSVCAAAYDVAQQTSGLSQGIVPAKSRLAKRGLSISRQELVAAHMTINLVDNLRGALKGFPETVVHCWVDSTVALRWICGGKEYR